MDRALRNLIIGSYLVFVLLITFLLRWNVFNSEELKAHSANKRNLLSENILERGKILSEDGSVLAESIVTAKGRERVYPYSSVYANVVGYASIKYGKSGLEASYDNILSPPSEDYFWLGKEKPRGKDLITTLNPAIQKKVHEILRSPGAIVVLDARSGAVRGLYSFPSFDPNKLNEDFTTLLKDARKPLLNRATAGLYPPGSTFKTIILAKYLDEDGSLDDKYEAPAIYPIGGFRITNYGKKSYGKITVEKAFVYSVNTVFAQIGLEVGEDGLRKIVRDLKIDSDPGFDIPVKKGRLPANLKDKVTLGWASVGQADLLVTPLSMAMVAQMIANDGVLVSPSLTQEKMVNNQRDSQRVISESTAHEAKKAMVEVVEKGTGKAARIKGIAIAGKTGTAEVKSGEPHAWFIGFAPADDPEIAVCVLVEHGGKGGDIAAKIFAEIVREALHE